MSKLNKNFNFNNINKKNNSLSNEDSSQYLKFNSKNQFLNNNNIQTPKFIIIKRYVFALFILLILYLLILLNFYKVSKIIIFIDKIKINKNNKIIKKNLMQNIKNNIKICICTLGKKENKNIREFIQHYENYEIDQIILYNNNEINGENFEDVIKDYIDKGFVKIIDWRGKNQSLIEIWNDCYLNNSEKFNWLIFYDIDEYIFLKNYTSIKSFLNEPKFKNCIKIYLNLVIHINNNLIYYDNTSFHVKLPEVERKFGKQKYCDGKVKYIIRGNTPNKTINNINIISIDIKECNGFGNEKEFNNFTQIKNLGFEYYYIDHYLNKSFKEEKRNTNKILFD